MIEVSLHPFAHTASLTITHALIDRAFRCFALLSRSLGLRWRVDQLLELAAAQPKLVGKLLYGGVLAIGNGDFESHCHLLARFGTVWRESASVCGP